MNHTPMIKQYLQIKERHTDAILFFRLGDFYEMFFEDAHCASRELDITLTGREGGREERIPMCGVPYHAAEGYIARLVEKGYKVAICEQVEDPKAVKGIVRREVVRVITPGTILSGSFIEDKRNNFIISVSREKEHYGLAVVDLGTGLFMVTEFAIDDTALAEEISRLQPSEAVVARDSFSKSELGIIFSGIFNITISQQPLDFFTFTQAYKSLVDNIGEEKLTENKLLEMTAAVCAAGGLLTYLKETQKTALQHLNAITVYKPSRFMVLDATTRKNLELTKSLREGTKWGSLLWVLDRTVTAMGGRLLKNWLEQPLLSAAKINLRLDAVAELIKDGFIRYDLKEILSKLYDLERLTGRIAYGTAGARDLNAIKVSLAVLPQIKEILARTSSVLLSKLSEQIEILDELYDLLERAVIDNPPVSVREGGMIKTGFNEKVDYLRSAGKDAKNWVAEMEARERERTGIKSLKVGFNKVFGYYLEVTKSNIHLVPEEYIRKQTLANAERYITPQLKEYENMILGARDKLNELEYSIFIDLRNIVADKIPALQKSARAAARADALMALAETAVEERYLRPSINSNGLIKIKEGRHPVVERVLKTGEFVPNDTDINEQDRRLVLLTGPNMAGKSTYMRQVALIVLLAQVGSFVPADYAEIGIVDRIFTRVGAADDLAGGQSTFMVEMNECKVIVENATAQSLIIMDEVGRGTSTYDGISIARALIEYINRDLKAKTLFSTHYHELTDLDQLHGVVNHTVAVQETGDGIVFLRKVIPGKADRSYGIHVARLAGIPENILLRADEVLNSLEACSPTGQSQAAASVDLSEISAFAELSVIKEEKKDVSSIMRDSEANRLSCSQEPVPWLRPKMLAILEELEGLDILAMNPLQAMNKLFELQGKLKDY
ncbi:DNA mismatch repair protein MutS [Desulfofarcimen acetoxidans DSM 771]|uniref:DNA mismatch repair protein MutS n=2 Tax=Desulfofarcimen acetoxidans TaxID=58138 RepID=C8VZ43_DESAS|nr:DNA mismatch repair protein MutS [Desulfofarcimen acetoxidans]ACV62953.1 DNA mismatch repair protein MutS [Desulfofarcimen acetoxidans DSM 771]